MRGNWFFILRNRDANRDALEPNPFLLSMPHVPSTFSSFYLTNTPTTSFSLSFPPSLHPPHQEKRSFGIIFKKRMTDAPLDRDEVIKAIAEKVDEDVFKVDLKDPDFTIVVEVFKNTAGIGLVRNYKALKK